MNFANVKGITIPEGAVKALSIDGVKVWEKIQGLIFKQSSYPGAYPYSVTFGNGIWVVADRSNGMYYSEDGLNWTQSNITTTMYHVEFGNGVFVATTEGNAGLWYSEDGKTWIQSNVTSGSFMYPFYNGELWVCGTKSSGGALGTYYSTDGKTWTKCTSDADFYTRIAYYADGLWVAGTTTGLWYSEDGIQWHQSNVTSVTGRSIVFADNLWVAATTSGLYYSTDGKTWSATDKTRQYYAVAYGNGVWVAGGLINQTNAAKPCYSTDGKSWTEITISDSTIWDLEYGNGNFIALSNTGVWQSTDGIKWNQVDGSLGVGNEAVFINNQWMLCVGSTGIWYSE